jgi:hypothetical protein
MSELKPIEIGLTAAIVAIEGNEPLILTAIGHDKLPTLPFGPFDAVSHRTFEIGLRAWVEEQAGTPRPATPRCMSLPSAISR